MDFGTRIKNLRLERNLTQEQLANKLNLSKANISKYESNDIEPNLKTICQLSELFDVSFDYLFGNLKQEKPIAVSSNNNDIEKIVDEILHNNSLTLGGEQISGKDLELLKNSLRSTIDMAKNMNKK
ncbi:MAG: helix-turn-helix transcriptional regulator [Peptostreptococcaceae bacterium]